MKLTGITAKLKKGAYNPKYNDCRFDIENGKHIDVGGTNPNIYWKLLHRVFVITLAQDKENNYSFESILAV